MNDNNFVKLGDVAHECRLTWSGDQTNIPIVGLEHLIPGEIELSSWDSNIEHTFSKKFTKGQVLLGRRRVYLKKAVVAPCDGICSGDITVIEATGGILPELLPFVIQNDRFFDYAMQGSAGSLSPRVKWEHLKNYEFPLPPLTEQKVLADKLWAAYRLKQSYKKLLAATEEMVKSQFIEMFSNKTWKEVYLEDVVSEDCSLSYGIVQPGDGVDDGIPVVRPVDLIDNIVEPDNLKRTTIDIANSYKRTSLKGGELLLCVRGTTGILSMASDRLKGGNVTRGIVPIWFKKNISKAFMFYQIKSDYVQAQIKENTYGTTLLQINIKDLRKIRIILPPEDLQLQFVTIAKQADKSGFELRKSIDAIEIVIQSLIN